MILLFRYLCYLGHNQAAQSLRILLNFTVLVENIIYRSLGILYILYPFRAFLHFAGIQFCDHSFVPI